MKKKHLLFLSILCIYNLPAFAQDTIYYDASWKVTVPSNAAYFRLKIKNGAGWLVKDCYLSGKLQMEGSYSDDSCTVSQGAFSYYNEKGQRYHTCHYVQGQLEGSDVLYYDSSKKRTEGNYKNGKMEGDWVGYYSSGKLSARAHFREGNQMSASFFNEDGTPNKSVIVFSRVNSFPGGPPGLQRFLIRNLHYPDTAVSRSIEGTVVIGFNITREGKIQDIKVLRPVEASLDNEALRVVTLMPDWEPLIIGGILCDSYQKQPIIFSLQE